MNPYLAASLVSSIALLAFLLVCMAIDARRGFANGPPMRVLVPWWCVTFVLLMLGIPK